MVFLCAANQGDRYLVRLVRDLIHRLLTTSPVVVLICLGSCVHAEQPDDTSAVLKELQTCRENPSAPCETVNLSVLPNAPIDDLVQYLGAPDRCYRPGDNAGGTAPVNRRCLPGSTWFWSHITRPPSGAMNGGLGLLCTVDASRKCVARLVPEI